MLKKGNIKTWLMTGGGVGSVVSMTNPSFSMKISARAAGRFRVQAYDVPGLNPERIPPGQPGAQIAAPLADPGPTVAGTAADDGWFTLNANESRTMPPLTDGSYYQDVEIWEQAAGAVDIDGTEPGWGR